MSHAVLVCPVVSPVHHHSVQAVALLLHVELKAPYPFLDHLALSHQAGKYYLKLQLQHQAWYGQSLAGISKVSQTLLFC